jgi:transposase
MAKSDAPDIVKLEPAQLEELLAKLKGPLSQELYQLVEKCLRTLQWIMGVIEAKNTTIGRLGRMLFGAKTEKTRGLFTPTAQAPCQGTTAASTTQRPKHKGHGRIGAAAYSGAKVVKVPHPKLRPGDPCPECKKGKLRLLKKPAQIVCITAKSLFEATCYQLDKLRCNLCGKLFTATPPPQAVAGKYDPVVGPLIGYMRFGGGVPHYRLERMQADAGVPIPASTQWELMAQCKEPLQSVYDTLATLAAQGHLFHTDDTHMRVQQLAKKTRATIEASITAATQGQLTGNDLASVLAQELASQTSPAIEAAISLAAKALPTHDNGALAQPQNPAKESSPTPQAQGGTPTQPPAKERTGVFTTGVLSEVDNHTIAIFITGHRHAGENIDKLLARRLAGSPPPIQMCDALSRNPSKEFQTILANCLSHGRRQFVDIAQSFPQQCQHVLEELGKVYQFDAQAKQLKLSAQERLLFHQQHSQKIMDDLRQWMGQQLEQKLVEPNSGLGKAYNYMLKHWGPLTLFLRQAGAPLDNNICERALKMAILHPKNSMSYKTINGALLGDMFMSAIHTCRLCVANPLDYLITIRLHAKEVAKQPTKWLPWNYKDALASADTG